MITPNTTTTHRGSAASAPPRHPTMTLRSLVLLFSVVVAVSGTQKNDKDVIPNKFREESEDLHARRAEADTNVAEAHGKLAETKTNFTNAQDELNRTNTVLTNDQHKLDETNRVLTHAQGKINETNTKMANAQDKLEEARARSANASFFYLVSAICKKIIT